MTVDLMDAMLLLLGLDKGGFIFPDIFLCQFLPPVRAVLANSLQMVIHNYRCLAEEAKSVLCKVRHWIPCS